MASQMLGPPADEVLDRLAAEWARWTDAASPLPTPVLEADGTAVVDVDPFRAGAALGCP